MKDKDIIAVFENDMDLVKAIGSLKESSIPVRDAYTPFPVHDVLKMLGRESRLPFFSVMAGAATIILVFAFLYYTAVIDYPLKYGGKPYFAFPSLVVIIYLLTILLTFISTVVVFQFRTGLFPGKEPEMLLPGSTDDRFILTVGVDEGLTGEMRSMAKEILKKSGALEIIEKEQ
jgi:hypothetical protein